MKVAFIVGHHEGAKGAVSPFLQSSEWDFYNRVGKHLNNIDVFQHSPHIRGYTQRIRNTAKKLDDYDLVIEGHFNAAIPQANGCETLYYFNSKKGKQYATIFSELVNEFTGIKLRNNGLKALVNSKDRGYQAVFQPKPPTILIEPFFGSNQEDCSRICNAQNVADIINTFIKLIQ